MLKVYFDHAATTPVIPQVITAMTDYMQNCPGNPSSLHSFGLEAKDSLEKSRKSVASLMGVEADTVTFTSGGTESDNIAILGSVLRQDKGHIITSKVEHPAVLDTCKYLAKKGYDVTFLDVDGFGMVDPEEVKKALRKDTILVSIMHANNEVGTINPISEIGKVIRENSDALFHIDAVQSYGKIAFDLKELEVDLMSVSAHKINGPKGVGALYKKRGVILNRLVYGGGQEKKLRSGTENMPGIVGMGVAANYAEKNLEQNFHEWQKLRNHLIDGVLNQISETRLNGHPTMRLPHNANFSFNYIEGEALLLHLDLNGVACSTGSACSSGSLEPSHVLRAMGIAPEWSHSSLRFSLGYENDEKQVDYTINILKEKVGLLRNASPFYKKPVQ